MSAPLCGLFASVDTVTVGSTGQTLEKLAVRSGALHVAGSVEASTIAPAGGFGDCTMTLSEPWDIASLVS